MCFPVVPFGALRTRPRSFEECLCISALCPCSEPLLSQLNSIMTDESSRCGMYRSLRRDLRWIRSHIFPFRIFPEIASKVELDAAAASIHTFQRRCSGRLDTRWKDAFRLFLPAGLAAYSCVGGSLASGPSERVLQACVRHVPVRDVVKSMSVGICVGLLLLLMLRDGRLRYSNLLTISADVLQQCRHLHFCRCFPLLARSLLAFPKPRCRLLGRVLIRCCGRCGRCCYGCCDAVVICGDIDELVRVIVLLGLMLSLLRIGCVVG